MKYQVTVEVEGVDASDAKRWLEKVLKDAIRGHVGEYFSILAKEPFPEDRTEEQREYVNNYPIVVESIREAIKTIDCKQ